VDDSVSAANPRKSRKSYNKLMEDVEARKVDAIVVWNHDRLHRRPAELEEFFSKCDAAGLTRLASVGGDKDLTNPDDVFMLRIMGNVGAIEVAKMRTRHKRERVQRAEKGLPNGGARPYGYSKDGMTLNDEEAANIRDAADRIIRGETLYSIQQDWNKQGIVPPGKVKDGKVHAWNDTVLKRIMTSPRIAGLRQHGREVIGQTKKGNPRYGDPIIVGPAAWPRIISPEERDQIIASVTQSDRQPRASHVYPLRGILICDECGRFLDAIVQKHTRTYGCRKDAGGCGRVTINADRTEAFVYSELIPLADNPNLRNIIRAEEASGAAGVRKLIMERSQAEAKLDEWDDKFTNNECDGRSHAKQTKILRDRIATVTAQITSHRGQNALDRLGGSVEDEWHTLRTDDRRLILESIVSGIRVARTGHTGRYDPERLAFQWRIETMAKVVKGGWGKVRKAS
jgi:DNA invertase Pin-like site-specific DNA recombinase